MGTVPFGTVEKYHLNLSVNTVGGSKIFLENLARPCAGFFFGVFMNYYEILGVKTNATQAEIRQAYKKLIKKLGSK